MEETPKFNSDWSFMDNQRLNQLQLSLDESLSQHDDILQSREQCEAFVAQFVVYFDECLTRLGDGNPELVQLIQFLRTNFRLLDAGGLNAGRSEQYNVLSYANEQLIELVGGDRYFSIVQTFEASEEQ